MFRIFKKRQNVFLKLIHDQAALTLDGLEALKTFMISRDPAASASLSTKEKEADEARRILIDELNRTFITPFDREDIFSLSRTIDDVLDYAYSTVSEMEIMKVEPTNYMQQMASILRDAAYELLMAVDRLEDHPGVASDHAQRAKGLENRVEEMYRAALADLFGGAEDIQGVIKMMKSREVYRHLSNAADRVDEAANVIGDIIVKITWDLAEFVSPIIIAIVILALLYAFLNGVNDSSSIVATMISSRALSARAALGLTAVAEFLGPFIFGIAVAKTIGHGIVQANVISTTVILAAMLAAVSWNLLTGFLGLPSSSSHALIGGLIGAVSMGAGWRAIQISGLEKTLIPLFAAPVIGFIIGFIILRIIIRLSWEAAPSINETFKRNQIFTVIALGLSHGSNDAPKAMGVITLALITEKYLNTFIVPTWVILLCAFAIAAGTAVGGERLIRTVGGKFYKIEPMDAFSTQLASAIVVMTASLTGGPVSASQVISSAIMGVGAAERPNKVRWKIAGDIGTAWLLTIPATALVAALIYKLLTRNIQ